MHQSMVHMPSSGVASGQQSRKEDPTAQERAPARHIIEGGGENPGVASVPGAVVVATATSSSVAGTAVVVEAE